MITKEHQLVLWPASQIVVGWMMILIPGFGRELDLMKPFVRMQLCQTW